MTVAKNYEYLALVVGKTVGKCEERIVRDGLGALAAAECGLEFATGGASALGANRVSIPQHVDTTHMTASALVTRVIEQGLAFDGRTGKENDCYPHRGNGAWALGAQALADVVAARVRSALRVWGFFTRRQRLEALQSSVLMALQRVPTPAETRVCSTLAEPAPARLALATMPERQDAFVAAEGLKHSFPVAELPKPVSVDTKMTQADISSAGIEPQSPSKVSASIQCALGSWGEENGIQLRGSEPAPDHLCERSSTKPKLAEGALAAHTEEERASAPLDECDPCCHSVRNENAEETQVSPFQSAHLGHAGVVPSLPLAGGFVVAALAESFGNARSSSYGCGPLPCGGNEVTSSVGPQPPSPAFERVRLSPDRHPAPTAEDEGALLALLRNGIDVPKKVVNHAVRHEFRPPSATAVNYTSRPVLSNQLATPREATSVAAHNFMRDLCRDQARVDEVIRLSSILLTSGALSARSRRPPLLKASLLVRLADLCRKNTLRDTTQLWWRHAALKRCVEEMNGQRSISSTTSNPPRSNMTRVSPVAQARDVVPRVDEAEGGDCILTLDSGHAEAIWQDPRALQMAPPSLGSTEDNSATQRKTLCEAPAPGDGAAVLVAELNALKAQLELIAGREALAKQREAAAAQREIVASEAAEDLRAALQHAEARANAAVKAEILAQEEARRFEEEARVANEKVAASRNIGVVHQATVAPIVSKAATIGAAQSESVLGAKRQSSKSSEVGNEKTPSIAASDALQQHPPKSSSGANAMHVAAANHFASTATSAREVHMPESTMAVSSAPGVGSTGMVAMAVDHFASSARRAADPIPAVAGASTMVLAAADSFASIASGAGATQQTSNISDTAQKPSSSHSSVQDVDDALLSGLAGGAGGLSSQVGTTQSNAIHSASELARGDSDASEGKSDSDGSSGGDIDDLLG